MKKITVERSPVSATKLHNSPIQFHDIVSYFILFGLGLGIGITLGFFYFKDGSMDFQLNQLSAFHASVPPPSMTLPAVPSNIHIENRMQDAFVQPTSPMAKNHTPSPMRKMKRKRRNCVKELFEPPGTRHNMTDEELFWRASFVPKIQEFPDRRIQKVAFMFLTRGKVLLAPLWEKFFRGHEGLYSIYVHSDPSFVESMPKSSVFHGRWIPSKIARWGEMNMVEAESRLLANALLDVTNERFVLLSESCIPLFNFSTVYDYLINSSKSFIESYDLPGPVGRGRYNNNMAPLIFLDQWRKGSQWFQIDRFLAVEVITDKTYFPIFWLYCKNECYGDEHYLPTFVDMKFPDRTAYKTLTYVDWSKGGPHPNRFRRKDVTEEFLKNIRSSTQCYYNGRVVDVCYLFARKFSPSTLNKLLRFSSIVMHF
ncbi:putative Calmodulin binding protein-like [Hibiscus syriacus]|uniref:Calmodulin binding protein-like n=1 Tax=Hibiscus syriacus TaxID=106335 RepID=A0A6A2YQL6_HIBSY|nr:glycosyltransferase BC10-like [Hibiscus syriacus]KAE8681512.1 putative Calmodulin binding protein-like [Hibiscus syriacus]